jgi:hypothetical protein
MEGESLRKLLAQVHAELEHGEPVDDETRDMLRTVMSDILTALEQPAAERAAEHHQSLGQRLKQATWKLESSHPRLTSIVSELVEDLGRIFQ